MPAVRFNAFQQIMRLWDAIHPYNAAQVMKLAGEPDVDRLRDAWTKALASLGVGRIRVDRATFRHDALDETRAKESVTCLNRSTRLDDHISREMNLAFESDDYSPFRPFILPASDGGYYLGTMYQHWVADSVAVRCVLREWFRQSRELCDTHGSSPMTIPSGGFWEHFGPHSSGWQIGDAILATLRLRTRFCRVRQMGEHASSSHPVRVTMHALPNGLIDDLRGATRLRGVTINDLLLAAVAEACHHHGATPRTSDRDELALGTIVDLRAMAAHDMDDLFGMFLGFITTVVRDRDAQDFPTLLRHIAAQNAGHKRSLAAQSSVLRMAGALFEARLASSPHVWADLYRRKMPMAGGMSNVNMNRTWAAECHPSPLVDYVRVAPTGPTVPLVLAVTTIGSKFNFTLTRRVGLVDDERARRLADGVIRRLSSFAADGR